MNYPYQRFPYYCWYNSMSNFDDDITERTEPLERLSETSTNCLKIGDTAPDFSLEGVLGGERIKINFNEQKGRWAVVFFYASDFTFV